MTNKKTIISLILFAVLLLAVVGYLYVRPTAISQPAESALSQPEDPGAGVAGPEDSSDENGSIPADMASASVSDTRTLQGSPSAIKLGLATYSEEQLELMLGGSAQEQAEAVRYVLAHPDAVNPFAYAYLFGALWEKGDRAQAAFWFYLFQVRTRPWAQSDTRGDGFAALRTALNDGFGMTINGWVGSDVQAWHDIAARAISYEKKVPLYAERPEGMTDAAWQKLVSDTRKEYEDGFTETFSEMLADVKGFEDQRRANGLYVGPLQAPGTPLPAHWI